MFHVARPIAALGLIRSPSASCFSCPAEAIATNKQYNSVTGVVLSRAVKTLVFNFLDGSGFSFRFGI